MRSMCLNHEQSVNDETAQSKAICIEYVSDSEGSLLDRDSNGEQEDEIDIALDEHKVNCDFELLIDKESIA